MKKKMKTQVKSNKKITAKALPFLSSALLGLACLTAVPLQAESKSVLSLEAITGQAQTATIKVLVLQDVEGALVEVKGPYNIYDPATGKKLESAFTSSTYYMHPTTDGIKWGAEFPGIFQVLIVPDSPKTSILVHGIEYRGGVYAYQMDGTIGFVNEVPLDDYTNSIVGSFIQGQNVEPEAISALAIACRTDALFKSRNGATKYWDVKGSQVGYQGAATVSVDKPVTDALQVTNKMVLQNAKPISWFNDATPSAPMQEIQGKAADGKDARAILCQFFPNEQIVLLK